MVNKNNLKLNMQLNLKFVQFCPELTEDDICDLVEFLIKIINIGLTKEKEKLS